MFHVMLVLPAFILLAVLAFLVLIGITAIIAAVIGGTSVALIMKNKKAKGLLFIGFGILLLSGVVLISPLIALYLELSALVGLVAIFLLYLGIAALAIAGIMAAKHVSHKVVQIVLTVVFSVVLAADAIMAIFTVLLHLLTKLQ